MLSGARAFVRDEIVDTLHAILHDPPALVLEDIPGVPQSLATIAGRLLEKAPAARFQSAAELIGTLERADVGRTRSWPVRQIGRIRAGLRQPIWKAAAVVVVLAAVSAGWLLWNTAPAIDWIAVLPFECTADDTEIDYICDGLHDVLIDHLARAQSLNVMARATVMGFKGEKDLPKVAHDLRVDAVVTGVVSRRGTQIVILVELHDETGRRLWRDEFPLSKAELMSVQGSIVLAIAGAPGLRLSAEETARLGGFGTNSPEAYILFFRGRFLLQSDTEEQDLEARKLFEKAIEIDRNFLDAHLGVVSTHIRSFAYAPPREAAAHALVALAKAAAIDPKNIAVRVSRAHLRLAETHDWEATENEYRAVLDEPALVRTTQFHPIALFFVAIGKPGEAVELVKRALVVDPRNLESRLMLGNYLQQALRLDEALEVYEKTRADEPESPDPLFGIADVYKQRSLFSRAADARRKAHELEGNEDAVQAFIGVTTEAGYGKAEKTVAQAQLHKFMELATRRYIAPFEIAHLHAQIGNRKQAVEWLEKAVKDGGHPGLMLLRVDPAWDSVRTDPKFADIVRGLRIP
jgi:adenylate cyclase